VFPMELPVESVQGLQVIPHSNGRGGARRFAQQVEGAGSGQTRKTIDPSKKVKRTLL
jgi:hypothetical protein